MKPQYLMLTFRPAREGGVISRDPNGRVCLVGRRSQISPEPGETWECRVEGVSASGRAAFVVPVRYVDARDVTVYLRRPVEVEVVWKRFTREPEVEAVRIDGTDYTDLWCAGRIEVYPEAHPVHEFCRSVVEYYDSWRRYFPTHAQVRVGWDRWCYKLWAGDTLFSWQRKGHEKGRSDCVRVMGLGWPMVSAWNVALGQTPEFSDPMDADYWPTCVADVRAMVEGMLESIPREV